MTRNKALGLFRLKVNKVLSVFKVYGMDVYIPGAADEINKAVDELLERLEQSE